MTEFCAKGSLYSFLKTYRDDPDHKSLPFYQRASFILDCARSVEHMHSRGLVHLDLKSLNFLVTESLRVKLTDVGECRRDGQLAEEGMVRPTTRNWSPPEVLCGEARDYRMSMDVYSLGLVIYVRNVQIKEEEE